MNSYASEHRGSTATTSSTSSVKSAIKSAARRYKEHNQGVQAAWEAYYGVYPAPAAAHPSRRSSEESTSSMESASKGPSTMKKAWSSIKERAVEHHASVNNAYAAYYGDSAVHRQRIEAVKQHDLMHSKA
jgi:hypothetical protein